MSNRLFANLGFLLQISGLLTILPISVSFVLNETQATISLFLTCVTFLASGFLLNSLCERKSLDFRDSNMLFLVSFIIMPLIGAIPYLYINPFASTNPVDTFTNGYFESVSGFTTTGFSFISEPTLLPQSLLVYRSLTELMGGVGIVFLLLSFFQSRKSLNSLSNSVGIEKIGGSLKRTYFSVFAIYSAIILLFTGIFFGLGFTNLISTGTFVIDTITGGFQAPAAQFQQYLTFVPKIFIMLLMLVGALNFTFLYNLFTVKLKNILSTEVCLFLVIIGAGTVALSMVSNVGALDSLFHVLSMSSSVGYSYIALPAFGETGLSIIIILMLIGGCTFSMAGGIRVSRLIAFAHSTKESLTAILVKENAIEKPKKTKDDNGSIEALSAPVSILFFIGVLVIFAVILTTSGVSFTNALFEVGSALTTNGISMGITSINMGLGYKWLMTAAMTIGRVEMLSILILLFSLGRKRIPELKKEVQEKLAPLIQT